MHKLTHTLRNYIDNTYGSRTDPIAMRKVHFITSFSLIGIFNFLVFGLLYLIDGQLLNAVTELGFGALAVINILVLRQRHRSQIAALAVATIMYLALLFLLFTGGIHATGLLWLYTFPAIVFFLLRRRIGLFWCGILGLSLLLVIGLESLGMTKTAYDILTLRQALITLGAVTLLLYFYEAYNEQSQDTAVKTNHRLSLLNDTLQQEVRDRQEAQVQYGMSLHEIEQKNHQLEDTKRAMLNMLEDLNEEKHSAEYTKLRDDALLRSIGEGLIFVDASGMIANINPSALKMLGYKDRDIIGRWFTNIIVARDQTGALIDAIDRPIVRAMSTGQVVTQIAQYQRKNKTFFPVSITISPVVLEGKPIGAIEVFRDITKEQELERTKEEFVSLASHQLRTPATGVKAYASMLLDGYAGPLSAKQRTFMEKVFQSNERQLDIVNDMLHVARVDAGRLVPDMIEMDLRPLLKDVIDEQRETVQERKQSLVVELGDRPIMMWADSKLLRMVVENLLSNASKYTPDGGKLAIKVTADEAVVAVSISDEGVGIEKSDLARLFQRFSRIDNTLSTSRGGTGLGLYLTANIVSLHRGKIDVKSRPGHGTTFIASLPIIEFSASKRLSKTRR